MEQNSIYNNGGDLIEKGQIVTSIVHPVSQCKAFHSYLWAYNGLLIYIKSSVASSLVGPREAKLQEYMYLQWA